MNQLLALCSTSLIVVGVMHPITDFGWLMMFFGTTGLVIAGKCDEKGIK